MEREKLKNYGIKRNKNYSDSFVVNNRPNACEFEKWNESILCDYQLWPEYPDNFKSTVLDYFSYMEALCVKLIPVFSRVMGLDPSHLNQFFSDPVTSLRMLCYPPSNGSNLWGINPHADFGCFTLLLQDNK